MRNHIPRKRAHRLPAVLLAAAAALLAGCSGKDYDPTADWSKERLYREAARAMGGGEFQQAIEYFETLEARYPFGPLALQAQLEIAYSYYKFGEYQSAIAAADRFIKLHPTHEGAAYAHYLRGLVRYNQGRTFLNDFVPRDMAAMDQQRLRKAFADFRVVVTEHPDSRYAPDARKRLVYLRNQMARHEYAVARFYFRRSAFTAAVNRVDYLLSHYDGAPVVPDALALQARAYDRLGLADLAGDTRRVLAASFPERAAAARASGEPAEAGETVTADTGDGSAPTPPPPD